MIIIICVRNAFLTKASKYDWNFLGFFPSYNDYVLRLKYNKQTKLGPKQME